MAILNAVVLPAKQTADGKNKIRISVAHNGQTRYIVTDIVVAQNEFRRGSIVRREDAAFLNTRLRKLINKYQKNIDEIEYVESMTCSELVALIKNDNRDRTFTLKDVYDDFISRSTAKKSTLYGYKSIFSVITARLKAETKMMLISPQVIEDFASKLLKSGLAMSSRKNILSFLRSLTNHAIKHDLATFKKNPWLNFKMPQTEVRKAWLPLEKLMMLRDLESRKKSVCHVRDVFMLSFYLGGINFIDMVSLDFREILKTGRVRYRRQKATRANSATEWIEFSLPHEAREPMERLLEWKAFMKCTVDDYRKTLSNIDKSIVQIRPLIDEPSLIFYSARKTFSQIAFELGIHTRVIDHLLGHSSRSGGSVNYHYFYVTPEMATDALRKVLDFIK